MAADVEAVTAVLDCPGDAADHVILLEHDRGDADQCELIGRGEPRWSRANDHATPVLGLVHSRHQDPVPSSLLASAKHD